MYFVFNTFGQNHNMRRILIYLCICPLLQPHRLQKDDERPKVNQLATMTTMVGWTKNDLGKWSSAINSLPKYSHDYFSLPASKSSKSI